MTCRFCQSGTQRYEPVQYLPFYNMAAMKSDVHTDMPSVQAYESSYEFKLLFMEVHIIQIVYVV